MLLLWGDGFLWFLSTSNALAVSLLKKRYGVWVVTNGMYGCHMLSRFRDLLKWKRNHIFKKQRISGERWKKKQKKFSFFIFSSLYIPLLLLLLHCIFFYYYYWRSISMPFLVATIVTMIWWIRHIQMPLITKITVADRLFTHLSIIYSVYQHLGEIKITLNETKPNLSV